MCVSYVNQFHYMGVSYFICQLNKWTRRVKVVLFKLQRGGGGGLMCIVLCPNVFVTIPFRPRHRCVIVHEVDVYGDRF